MRLALIAMSGTGKSYWSFKLEAIGYRRLCCDERIAARLAPELRAAGAPDGQMGPWLGMPYDPGYAERAARYAALEHEVVAEILDELEGLPEDRAADIVVDTTGSVVYLDAALLERLRRLCTVVYLAVPGAQRDAMLARYLAQPRPVLWHGHYAPRPGETRQDALARCYAELLAARQAQYEALAHVTIAHAQRAQPGFDAHALIEAAKRPLRDEKP